MAATDQFLPLLAAGDVTGAAALFGGSPVVDDPESGHIEGADAFEAFGRESADWFAETGATISHIDTTTASGREVTEQSLSWHGVELPIALVGELTDGGRLAALRIYHSTWPLTEAHAVRPALLPGDPDAALLDVVGDYHRALASKHLDGALAAFEPDGYVREPSGSAHLHRGLDERASFYDRLFEFGEVILDHCTVTDDGVTAVLEYNVVRWGPRELTPQAGVAVHRRGASGLLSAVRIYDDVDFSL